MISLSVKHEAYRVWMGTHGHIVACRIDGSEWQTVGSFGVNCNDMGFPLLIGAHVAWVIT